MLEIQSSSKGEQKFFIFIRQKNFIFILCLKSIGRYQLYLPILLADTTKIGRYRYSSIGTSLAINKNFFTQYPQAYGTTLSVKINNETLPQQKS